MTSSSRKGLEVFDFKADDEAVEFAAAERFLGKFRNPNPYDDLSPLTKDTFLHSFARGTSDQTSCQTMEICDVSCVGIDATSSNHKCTNHGSDALATSVGDCAITEVMSTPEEVPISYSISHGEHAHTNPHPTEPDLCFPGCSSVNSLASGSANPLVMESGLRVPSPGKKQNNLEFQSNSDPVDVLSDDDDESTAHSSDVGEDQGSLEGSASDDSGWEMHNTDVAVAVEPDYLVYGEKYSTESSLRFYCSGIKLEGTNAYGGKESFSKEWGIDEIIGIESLWYARVETALVKLSIRPTVDGGAENQDESIGLLELKFAVCDSSWSEIEENILSMDPRYRAAWRFLPDTDDREADGFVREKTICGLQRYYPDFDEPFEEVIYPKGDPDAVSISKRDVELLQPETFINDTIIDFYIKYLKNKIESQDRHRFHFFNSFFFRKLADMDKDPASASEGRAAFLRVRKWTRKVNLFEKDFVFIPVNFNLHWSLLVVCHPGEVVSFRDGEIGKPVKVPCILHMDSIKGSHKGLKNLVQSYLWEEWKERHEDSSEDISAKFSNLRFVPLEVPQQENLFDCGLFLLHYVELFLEEAPVCFSPFMITKFTSFLNIDWFPPAEASLKRACIQKLIYDLLEHNPQKNRLAASYNEYHSSRSLETGDENGHCAEFHLEKQSPARTFNGNSSCSIADQGIEMKLLTSPRVSHFVRDSGFVLRELLEPGSTSGSFTCGQVIPPDQITSNHRFKAVMSPVKEVEESSEQFADSPSIGAPGGIAGNTCTTSNAFEGFSVFDIVESGISIEQDEFYSDSSATETSSSESSSEARVDEGVSVGGMGFSNEEDGEDARSASPENVGCITGSPASGCIIDGGLETCVVEDSQEVDRMDEKDLASSSRNQTADAGGGDEVSEAEEPPTKKPRLMVEAERRCTRSAKKDDHS